MKSKFRFKSLMLVLLMIVNSVLSIGLQNPIAANVLAESTDSLKDGSLQSTELSVKYEDKKEHGTDDKDGQKIFLESFLRNHQNFTEEFTAMLWDALFGGFTAGIMVWIWNTFMFSSMVLGPHGIVFFVSTGVLTRSVPGLIKVSKIIADQIKLIKKSFV